MLPIRRLVTFGVLVSLSACGSETPKTVAPVTPVAILLNAPVDEADAMVMVGGDGVAAYRYRLDGGEYSPAVFTASPIQLEGLVAGEHTLEVLAIDGGGLAQPEAAPTQHVWTVKLAWIEAEVVHGATSLDVIVALNAAGTVRYTIAAPTKNDVVDSGTITLPDAYTSVRTTVEGLRDGVTHFVYLAAEDGAGNPAEVGQEITFTTEERHGTRSFQTNVDTNVTIGYYVYAPEAYYKSPDEDFPLLVFFHGAGERGPGDTSELYRVLTHGPPRLIEDGWEFPFIVVSPQTTFDLDWNLRTMDEMVELIRETYRVDNRRIYITGISMGGNATWNYITSFPDKVAAAIPISGWGSSGRACLARDVPIWAFHGDADPTVSVSGTRQMINALGRCDPPPRIPPIYTEYPGVGHNAWTRTYDNSATGGDIYEWLMMHENTAP